MSRRSRRSRDEGGYIAMMTAVVLSSLLLGLAAIGLDVARWYVEAERIQTAADAAALSGVVFLPDNLPRAVQTARTSAELNGYRHGVNATVEVAYGERRSQLDVTITTRVANQFGASFGVDSARVTRHATADYTSPAPMGSPCNVFGNEPPGGTVAAAGPTSSGPRDSQIPSAYSSSKICTSEPNFWAAIEGPQTDKQNGDRYSTAPCTLKSKEGAGDLPYGCTASKNSEATYPDGYFYAIKVPQDAVGSAITLQLYDPAFMNTGASCTSMPNTNGENYLNNRNPYSTESYDSYYRYTRLDQVPAGSARNYARRFCTGDSVPTRAITAPDTRQYAPVTSFAVRSANDSDDPTQGAALAGCTAQFAGQLNPPTLAELTTPGSGYRQPAAQVFHQWVKLCTFTPTRAGDYYLQARTNVALPGSVKPHEFRGTTSSANRYPFRSFNPSTQEYRPTTYRYDNNSAVHTSSGTYATGEGVNAFGIRAISSAAAKISVSGWSRMPMLQNVPDSTATFNLLRVLPAAAGQSISFEFYDVADGADDVGTVQVVPPKTASGATPPAYNTCQAALNEKSFANTDPGCKVTVSNASHNGQVQRMSIPIPNDYSCRDTELTGCWFQVKITLNGNITDFTTWDAALEGDPVRLIE